MKIIQEMERRTRLAPDGIKVLVASPSHVGYQRDTAAQTVTIQLHNYRVVLTARELERAQTVLDTGTLLKRDNDEGERADA